MKAPKRSSCPNCGNANPSLLQDNSEEPSSPDLTLFCVARVQGMPMRNPDPRYLIDWLGNVFDACDLYFVGTLICGPDDRGYTLTDSGQRKHVAAAEIWIQRAPRGAYEQAQP